MKRMPVVYLPHGGGPWSFVDFGVPEAEVKRLADYWRSLPAVHTETPKALLVVSAHWEASKATVMSGANPPMLYDYYGFPKAAYEITWPAPGQPAIAARVRALLEAAGFATAEDTERGFDHGTFVPLKRAYPDADVPAVQLSLLTGLDPKKHLALGRALAPLRDEGVFIIGSGLSYHNMRAFQTARAGPGSVPFDTWLAETLALDREAREQRLADWAKAPGAREAHPREEHLLPLMVAAGAAGDDPAKRAFHGDVLGARVSAFHFG